MRLVELQLQNFRCFEKLTLTFSTPYTILIGVNGSGKSTVLDAIRIFLDGLVTSARLIQNHEITFTIYDLEILFSDIRRKITLNGSILEPVPQYPSSISGTVEDKNGENISWKNVSVHYKDVVNDKKMEQSQLLDYLSRLRERIVNEENVVFPVIACYGTNRR